MNAISIHQPWATLIVHDHKRIETRSWRPPRTAIGKPLLIHAAKWWTPAYDELIQQEPFASCLTGIELPKGGLVGVATLVSHFPSSVFKVDEAGSFCSGKEHFFIPPAEAAFGNYGPNRHGWHLAGICRFRKPIPYRGSQGIFKVPDRVVTHAIADSIPVCR